MDLIGKTAGVTTPVKDSHGSRSKSREVLRCSENLNPNVSPGPKSSNSPAIKSAKSQKSASKNQNQNPNPNPVVFSPRNKIRERKFVIAKRKNSKKEDLGTNVACKCKEKAGGGNSKKCLCVAYESLRASQEEFFKNRRSGDGGGLSDSTCPKVVDQAEIELEEEIEKSLMIQDCQIEDGYQAKVGEDEVSVLSESENGEPGEVDPLNRIGSSTVKRRRAKLLEEARNSVPECGKVMHLVKAFEKLLSIPSSKESDDQKNDHEDEQVQENHKKAMKWALPGLQSPSVLETQVSSSSFCPSDLFLTSENLGLDPRASVSSSWDSSLGSISSRNSSGGRRSRRNSSETVSTIGGSRWKKKKLKATSSKPFKLRTEQRGKLKEEEFLKKLQDMMGEEERLRIPIAQGLPWTTDEPECLLKPFIKERTRPLDLKLHSDVRAVERAEFDHQVAEKMSLMEMYKMEKERRQKMAEEEEIRRLRKELVPKAQPMPYFDRPFIPRRSMKHPTIPREPKFHAPQHKKIKSCLSLSDFGSYTSQH
ncbi:hypothetical protein L484_021006 [Morus notabilis]|uniref:TPX2 C-terminal domain-containing protein n=1 Tax=Morus notabilis TaxID=981085 RepID=W9QTH7_9ROSA|nr:uncharacterized protein LOC21403874 [Morus notabilis]EXB38085.1 hypothetical protein L484_021006 [Morus notabilis]